MWNPFTKTEVPETKAISQHSADGWYDIGGRVTSSGQRINNTTALAVSTVYDCIRIISEDVAKLPIQIIQELSSGIKEKRRDNPLYNVLNWNPNLEMTAMSFWTSIVSHSVGWGNGYAEKVRDENGQIIQLWILPPDRVTVARNNQGILIYEVREDNGQVSKVSTDKIFHVPGFGYDGVQGYNPIQIARESLGLTKAAEDFGGKFFGNGGKTSMALTFPSTLSEPARQNLQKSMQKQIGGENQHRILLVEEGGDIKTMSLNQKDSQYLETREFQLSEICRWFRVPPHKVADLRRATFSNIEEQNIDYVVDTLQPWFTRIEQAIYSQLLTPQEQMDGYFAKHNVNALLRGKTKERFEAYASGINNGWLTRNEVREKEDLNPLDGLDEPLVPMNMTVVGEEPIETGSNDAFVDDVAARITTAEERGLSARVDKANDDRDRFNEWVNCFYEKHEQYIIKCLSPLNLSQKTADRMVVEGILNIAMSDDPAAHIKTWNRKQEIKDIINEAMTVKGITNG